ncbi:MAG: hypothetical protein HZA15_15450 [Nitrospirae bacterium]|nr:hypothetical protein [Nitrospirota bacterium]
MRKIIITLMLLMGVMNAAPANATTTVSVCNMPSAAAVEIRVYDNTDSAEDVAWTATGVTERAVGLSKSCYHYDATLTAAHTYQIDWRDAATPTKVASDTVTPDAAIVLPVMQGQIYTAVASQAREVVIIRGDTPRITFDLGAAYSGWTPKFGAKASPSDTAYVIAVKDATWTDATAGEGYVDLTAAETATVGKLSAEIELQNGTQRLTAIKFKLTIREDVIR